MKQWLPLVQHSTAIHDCSIWSSRGHYRPDYQLATRRVMCVASFKQNVKMSEYVKYAGDYVVNLTVHSDSCWNTGYTSQSISTDRKSVV